MLAIDIQSLLFSYQQGHSHGPHDHPGADSAVISIDHWQLAQGQRCFLYGRSGSGKSTLLRLLCGLMPPQQGRIQLLGEDITALKPAAMDRFRSQNIGLVSQQLHLLPYLTVAENIALAARLANKVDAQLDQRIATLLQQLQLPASLMHSPAHRLSQGQQQRVAIARALVNQPPLVLVDEPTSSLDYESADAFMHLLLNTLAAETTVLMISHDQRHAPLFDQALSLQTLMQPTEPAAATTMEGR
ncbi:ABC transporter ATP-binding protein [Oceanobacter kriegii]|uniref:ABC transporter ATP-binding protein n=1 Tax=Oceanobacter kriegii TaxID=64972 RepID=UPI0004266E10|nr:ATP-binding cassette domain-containing protein [Oceanobacter kriegii]